MEKYAYPQMDGNFQVTSPRNIQRWLETMKTIYSMVNRGFEWRDSFNKMTSNWGKMEKKDFEYWMKFYQQGEHTKYKIAQFVPTINNLRSTLPGHHNIIPFTDQHNVDDLVGRQAQKEQVERKIRSLIGRLNSAEKIATDPYVQVALKKCLQMSVEEWVSLLQKLKREIQLVPMRATSISLMDDIIYKNANQINTNGNNKQAALMLIKVAQGILSPADTPMGGQPLGEETEPELGIEKFIENLNGDDLAEIEDDEIIGPIKTAQMVPPPRPNVPKPALEVSEEEIKPPPAASLSGDPFDQALANVKIPEIVTRLEGIASLFKNRQIARQLSIIDLMMDKTGIAPFFPTLAEAMRSALESNQYCQSRVEDILAKLRGTISTPMSEHMEGEVSGKNEIDIQSQLAQQEIAERQRKERRKMIQDQEETAKLAPPKPPIPAQELAGPSKVQSAPPLRPTG